MSACIRSLYSSDQWAPGFVLALLRGCESGGVLPSLGDFRTPTFNLSVTRGDWGFRDGFELFMQLYVTHLGLLSRCADDRQTISRILIRYDSYISAVCSRKCNAFACDYTREITKRIRDCASANSVRVLPTNYIVDRKGCRALLHGSGMPPSQRIERLDQRRHV